MHRSKDKLRDTTRSIGKSPFEVVYEVHPRGIYELRDLSGMDRNAQGEDFVAAMHDIHKQVEETLEKNVDKYKRKADLKKRDVQFKVGDLHLSKEGLPKSKYTKLMMKKIGPCKVVHKYDNNAYEIELPPGVAISPIFNVTDLYPYKESDFAGQGEGGVEDADMEWVNDLSLAQPTQLEAILDSREVKRTRKVYKEHQVVGSTK
ncbi:uncharacterized protein LOC131037953 [Cryptomeria japonica]|uniref:uncharacterized protein LOC131037953 n=1 Tax=Cryptomeria japonica TaxID=3369 RepID=UPI0027DA4CA3|nr:uncharacterized protein LOC131037953 [Cryptomeria japonica]